MLEEAVYLATLALFGFVILGTAGIRHEMLLIACMPAVFVALVMGFTMALYSWDQYGLLPVLVALLAPLPVARRLARRFSARDMLLVVYLAWAAALALALIGMGFPDAE